MRRSKQRGAASLIVVMVLFFIMSLVAAYTSRNLIFEQRTSVNQYRSTQAHEAAEAGLEWALAQLNGGRIDGNCLEAGATNDDTSFRQRYLAINTNPPPDPNSGMITARMQSPPAVAAAPPAPPAPRRAGCVWDGATWSCSCPSENNPALAAPGGTGIFPAFWVSFSTNLVTRPGVVQIVVNGCTRLDAACLSSPANSNDVEGRALVTAVVALKSAITTTPVAALTVLGQVDRVGSVGTLTALNTEPESGGITIQSGGPVGTGNLTVRSIPGTPVSASVIAGDRSLSDLLLEFPADLTAAGYVSADRVFASTFGAWPNAVRWQPGALRLICPVADCREALVNAVALNPDRVIWIEGDLRLDSAGSIGSMPNPDDLTVAGPATIVATGNFIGPAAGVDLKLYGFLYTRAGNWTRGGEIQGAAFVESNLLAATAAQTVVYNGRVLDTLRLRAGSFVRVPGGWRDFP